MMPLEFVMWLNLVWIGMRGKILGRFYLLHHKTQRTEKVNDEMPQRTYGFNKFVEGDARTSTLLDSAAKYLYSNTFDLITY